ncbi:MAG: enoyl-CoA hydratase/isomerase family protein [Phycisphaerales bacterium]|nr:enoyl-CoA hydratase/isomerase family protein [Phycisphaerales bacterium]
MVIRLDRAEKRNALTVGMLKSLGQALDNSMSAGAVVVSGVGDVFCAGFDLSACRDDAGVLGALLTGLAAVCRGMRGHPAPVVVSAHGAAIAGGCAMVAAADIAVTDGGAKIGYPVVRLGVSPAVSGPMLRVGIGDGRARERMLDSGLIDGWGAKRMGLVHECVKTAAECEARGIEIARGLAEKPRHAIGYTKAWLNEVDGSMDEARLEAGLLASLSRVGSAEERELLDQVWKKA